MILSIKVLFKVKNKKKQIPPKSSSKYVEPCLLGWWACN